MTTTDTGTTGRTPVPGQAAQVLRDAADLIEANGWWRGEYWPGASASADDPTDPDYPYVDGDPCCALGAIAVAAGVGDPGAVMPALARRPVLIEAVRALYRAFEGEPDESDTPVMLALAVEQWNDCDDRAAADVVATLRRAAGSLTVSNRPGGPSAKTSHQAGSPNHQNDSKETDV